VEQTFESLVGTLKAAKSRGIIDFKGHLLLFPTNKDTVISILTPFNGNSSAAQLGNSKSKSKTWTVPDDILKTRTEFQQEREKFEQKILEEWTDAELRLYHRAKLDAEIKYFQSAGGIFNSVAGIKDTVSAEEVAKIIANPVKQQTKTAYVVEKAEKPPTPEKTPVAVEKPSAVEKVLVAIEKSPEFSATGNSEEDSVVKAVRNIMNKIFKKMKAGFVESQSYDSEYILSVGKSTIVETTMELEGDPNMQKIKEIMNGVYKTLKGKFPAGAQYSGGTIHTSLKDIIVGTTNDLLKSASSANGNVITNTNSNSNPPEPTKNAEPPIIKPKPIGSSASATKNATATLHSSSSSTTTTTPKLQKGPMTKAVAAKTEPLEQTSQAPPAGESGEAPLSLEQTKKEAFDRINKNPKQKEVDLSDPLLLDCYVKMRGDALNWMIMGYRPENKDRLVVLYSGSGDFQELRENIPDDKPVYMYLNFHFGDTGRSRFIFMSYVPENLGPLEKSRVVGHKGDTEKFFKYFHVTWHMNSLDDLSEEELTKKLLKAGGANYSVQESNKGDFSSYKQKTREFYSETDKRTEVKAIYHTGPLTTTPCDISGRPMVAPPAEALKNTSDFFKGPK